MADKPKKFEKIAKLEDLGWNDCCDAWEAYVKELEQRLVDANETIDDLSDMVDLYIAPPKAK